VQADKEQRASGCLGLFPGRPDARVAYGRGFQRASSPNARASPTLCSHALNAAWSPLRWRRSTASQATWRCRVPASLVTSPVEWIFRTYPPGVATAGACTSGWPQGTAKAGSCATPTRAHPRHGAGLPGRRVSLARARERAQERRVQIAEGIDPIKHREQKKAELKATAIQLEQASMTFKACAEEYHTEHAGDWKNAKHKDRWLNTLTTYAFPHGSLGEKVNDVRFELIGNRGHLDLRLSGDQVCRGRPLRCRSSAPQPRGDSGGYTCGTQSASGEARRRPLAVEQRHRFGCITEVTKPAVVRAHFRFVMPDLIPELEAHDVWTHLPRRFE
jgi:hypothetical protein